MSHGSIIVLSGAGGSGKTTIRNGLLEALPTATTITKVTTRPRRAGEGTEFRFVSQAEFDALRNRDEFFDAMEFGGNAYGIPRATIDAALAAGSMIILVLDADGARHVRTAYPDRSLWVFLTAPEAILRERMAAHGDSPARIEERLRLAPLREYPRDGEADLVVENIQGHPERTIATIAEFVQKRLG